MKTLIVLFVALLLLVPSPVFADACDDQLSFPPENCMALTVYTVGGVIFPLTLIVWAGFLLYSVLRILLGVIPGS